MTCKGLAASKLHVLNNAMLPICFQLYCSSYDPSLTFVCAGNWHQWAIIKDLNSTLTPLEV